MLTKEEELELEDWDCSDGGSSGGSQLASTATAAPTGIAPVEVDLVVGVAVALAWAPGEPSDANSMAGMIASTGGEPSGPVKAPLDPSSLNIATRRRLEPNESRESVAVELAPHVGEGAGSRGSLCALWMGDSCFGLPMSVVGEVAQVESLADVPAAPRHIVGIFSLRGVAIPIVDLLGALGLGKSSKIDKALLIREGTLRFAVPVDRVEVVAGRRQGVVHRRAPGDHAAVAGFVAMDDGRLVTLLSATRVLTTVAALRDAYY